MMRFRDLEVFGCGVPILRDVRFELPDSGLAILLGPSGCGKTTLMRCTIREDHEDPDLEVSGSIELDGRNIRSFDLPITRLRQRIGLISQRPVPFPGTAFENVTFALERTTRLEPDGIKRRAKDALEEVGLEPEHYDTPAECLSGGQLKRLAIARAIALSPDVLLMDEPSSGLDPISIARLERLATRLARERLVVVVTHDVHMARRIGDIVHVLWPFPEGSRIVEAGPARRVLDDPHRAETKLFVEMADRGAGALAAYERNLVDVEAEECAPRRLEFVHSSQP